MIPPSATLPKPQTFQPPRPIERLTRTAQATLNRVGTLPRFGADGEKLGFMKTLSTLASHFKKPGNQQFVKGYLVQFGPDVAIPAMFSIPVVGWALGLMALPFTWWTNKKGAGMVQEASKHHSNKDNPFADAVKLQNAWSEDWKKPDLAKTLAEHYDNVIRKLFPKAKDAEDPNIRKLRKTLKIGKKKRESSKIFEFINRSVNAKQALEVSWIYKPFKLLSFLYEKIKFVPRPLRKVLLVPKFCLLGLFFFLKKAPK